MNEHSKHTIDLGNYGIDITCDKEPTTLCPLGKTDWEVAKQAKKSDETVTFTGYNSQREGEILGVYKATRVCEIAFSGPAEDIEKNLS